MNALGSHTTDLQRSKVQTQANHIGQKIKAWIDVQKVYMPRTTLLQVRDDVHCPAGIEVHSSKILLYLPSAALKLNAINPTIQITIIDDEQCLQLAQANNILASLCDHLLLRLYLTVWHQHFNQGQCYGTKANTLFHQVETKIAADVAQYQCIYVALDTILTKSNQFEWHGVLLPLKEEDICGLDQYNESTSEGHCNLSWIWKTNLHGGDEGLQEDK